MNLCAEGLLVHVETGSLCLQRIKVEKLHLQRQIALQYLASRLRETCVDEEDYPVNRLYERGSDQSPYVLGCNRVPCR